MDEITIPGVEMQHSKPRLLHIPTEVCENIIDTLYSGWTNITRENISTLHSCALVCRDWRVRSQRMLFYHVQLADTTSFRRLSTILDHAPHLRDYVFRVELTGYHLHYTTSIFALFPAVFAGKLPNLFHINVTNVPDTVVPWFPTGRASDSPKARALPYIPLHPRFPAFLSAFTVVSELRLMNTTFRSFTEFARMLHGLPNLDQLVCYSIRWIASGGSHPGADFTKRPEWAAGKDTLPPFAPKLRDLYLFDIALYGAKRLIWTRGPHLTRLSLAIPVSSDPEELADGQGLDLGSCTGLKFLTLYLTPQFSMDVHGGFTTELLASWKPLHLNSTLRLTPNHEDEITRQGFAEVLRGLGTITEAWLQTFEEPPPSGEIRDHQQAKYWLEVLMYESEAWRRWWVGHLENCFPTWMKLGRIELIISTPQDEYDEWADEVEPTQSGPAAVSQVEEVESSSLSKDAPSSQTIEPA